MRRSIALLVVGVFVLGLIGCGGGDSPAPVADNSSSPDTTAGGGTATPGPAPGPAAGMGGETRSPDTGGSTDPAAMMGGGYGAGESRDPTGVDTATDPSTMSGSGYGAGESRDPTGVDSAADPTALTGGGAGYGSGTRDPSGTDTATDPAALTGGGAGYGGDTRDPTGTDTATDPTALTGGGAGYGGDARDPTGTDTATDPAALTGGGAGYGGDARDPSGGTDTTGTDPGNLGDPSAGYGGGEGRGNGQAKKSGDFAEMASSAFSRGNESDAIDYLYALALTDAQAGPKMLANFKWTPGLRRPTLATRWGVGIDYKPAKGYSGGAFPPGSTQKMKEKNRGGGSGGSPSGIGGIDAGGGAPDIGGGSEGGIGGGGGSGELDKLTGDVGKEVLNNLRERIGDGSFGTVLQTASKLKGGNGGAGGGYGASGGAGGYGGAGGDIGGISGGAPGGAGGYGGGGFGGGNRVSSLMPGVVMLGKGAPNELLAKAASEGIDVLIVFDVVVASSPRTGLVTNNIKLDVYDVQSGKEIVSTRKAINNLQVQNIREGKKPDPVAAEVGKLFQAADLQFKGTSMPTGLKPEHVASRVSQLLSGKSNNPLAVLAEVRFYNSLELVSDEQLKGAYGQILGPDMGEKLASSKAEDRQAALAGVLPGAKKAQAQPNVFR